LSREDRKKLQLAPQIALQMFSRIMDYLARKETPSQNADVDRVDFKRQQAPAFIQSLKQQFGERSGAWAQLDHRVVRHKAAELGQSAPTVKGSLMNSPQK
jgi:hypothetical protein